jgi:hypothetical protein
MVVVDTPPLIADNKILTLLLKTKCECVCMCVFFMMAI